MPLIEASWAIIMFVLGVVSGAAYWHFTGKIA